MMRMSNAGMIYSANGIILCMFAYMRSWGGSALIIYFKLCTTLGTIDSVLISLSLSDT